MTMHPATWLTLLALALLLWAEAREHRTACAIFKPLASTGFILVGLAAGGTQDGYGTAIMAALVLSWVGDVCLLSSRTAWFLAGLSSFLLAHVAFGIAFWGLGPSWTAIGYCAVPLAVAALIVRHWLRPHVPGAMRRPVDAYMLVISGMLALAVGATVAGASGMVLLGALMFYLSDLSVARQRFVQRSFTNKLWGLPLYYVAQLVLASTIGG